MATAKVEATDPIVGRRCIYIWCAVSICIRDWRGVVAQPAPRCDFLDGTTAVDGILTVWTRLWIASACRTLGDPGTLDTRALESIRAEPIEEPGCSRICGV